MRKIILSLNFRETYGVIIPPLYLVAKAISILPARPFDPIYLLKAGVCIRNLSQSWRRNVDLEIALFSYVFLFFSYIDKAATPQIENRGIFSTIYPFSVSAA